MTISLSFHDDTWRVRVLITDRPDGTVRVERSTNGVFWRPVRGGDPVEVVDGTAFVDDWEYQEGVLNTYRVVPVDPPAGLLLTGESGDYASTPDTSVLDITGNIDIRVDVTVDDWTAEQTLISKFLATDNQRSWRFGLVGGQLIFDWATAGEGGVPSATTTGFETPDAGTRMLLRTTLTVNVSGDWQCRFFRGRGAIGSTDSADWELIQLVTGSPNTSIFNSSAAVEIGSLNGGTGLLLKGVVHSAQVLNGVNGTAVIDVDFAAQDHRDVGFTDSTGRVWTVHGDALIVGVESDTITPSHNGKIILKSVRFPFVNRPVTVTDFTDPELGDRGGLFEVSGRAVPISTPDQRASNAFEVEIMTETRQQARDVQLILRANPHLFLHTPAGCPVPGGHVRVGTVPAPRRATRSASSDRRYWRLPCRLVAPPSPKVVAGTMTYAGLLNLYGGYDNVLAANPAYADLLELMGSPEDLVVV
jgi:hypothetical protein